jgi:polyhydroxyalkanoate synthase
MPEMIVTTEATKATQQALDPANQEKWSEILIKIAERSQKLLKDFTDRNNSEALSIFFPPNDPAHLNDAFSELVNRVLSSPEKAMDAQIAFWQDYIKLCRVALAHMSGEKVENPTVIAPDKSDKRFKDPAWTEMWLFDYIKQSYLLTARLAENMVEKVDGLDPRIMKKIDFYTRQMVDAMAPSNFWVTNPEVLRTTLETGGDNLIKGLEKLLGDLEKGRGELVITMSQNQMFRFGENIATTPGKVVFQNEMMQLLMFAPETETVFRTPFLIVPPWINKYYILDLKEKNSFVRHLVRQGHTVFCISWVNPDARHAQMGFEEYMNLGPIQAMRKIKEITHEDTVNVLGYCIGGTLLACAMAYLKGLGDSRPRDIPQVNSMTYLVALVDFSKPGELGVFIDEDQVHAIEKRMEIKGYLDASALNLTFNLLRANDLVWSFVVNNYLMGKEPFPFDLLSWNSDSTNLPAKMQSFYLRNMYMENNLIKPNGIKLNNMPINLQKVDTPAFILAAREDHITLWNGVYTGTQVWRGPVKFVLAKSGHIAGVINPPAPNKYGYYTNDETPADPEAWFSKAESHDGSWWPTWYEWLKGYAGEQIPARDPAKCPDALEDAPGSYVRVRIL